jgi:hypothetical protein
MPAKSARSRSRSAKTTSAKKGIAIIVKRGATRRFHTLKRDTAEMPVTILWDRRTSERRTAARDGATPAARDGVDRRKKPAFTWDLADFVVVAPPKRQKGSRKTPTRKS